MHLNEGEDEYVTKTAYNRETGLPRIQQTYLNRKLHAPPTGEPSKVVFDDQGLPLELYWHAFNLEHRGDGPSSVRLHEGTDQPSVETFKREGQPREPRLGPYRIIRSLGGEVRDEKYATKKDMFPQSTIDHHRNWLEP